MKKALLIHGFEGSKNSNWLPWLEEQLTQFHYKVINETLPNRKHPDFDETMAFLEDLTKDFGWDDMIVGHSLGGYFALKLAEKLKLDRLFLVAPAVGQLPFSRYKEIWPDSDVDAVESILQHGFDLSKTTANQKIAIFSQDDHLIPVDSATLFDESWKVYVLRDFGHFQEKAYPDFFFKFMTL